LIPEKDALFRSNEELTLAKQEQKAPPKKAGVRVKKKIARTVPAGIAHVKATFNNTTVAITDLAGNVISWSSAGKANFSGSKKSSSFAATVAAQNAAKDAMALGMRECEVNLNGPGAGRESAVRGLMSAGLSVSIIRDKTPVPHNGCRARKRRRV
jgi:small subunit ribosomal protein S11